MVLCLWAYLPVFIYVCLQTLTLPKTWDIYKVHIWYAYFLGQAWAVDTVTLTLGLHITQGHHGVPQILHVVVVVVVSCLKLLSNFSACLFPGGAEISAEGRQEQIKGK